MCSVGSSAAEVVPTDLAAVPVAGLLLDVATGMSAEGLLLDVAGSVGAAVAGAGELPAKTSS
jgi:hypothetical protein